MKATPQYEEINAIGN